MSLPVAIARADSDRPLFPQSKYEILGPPDPQKQAEVLMAANPAGLVPEGTQFENGDFESGPGIGWREHSALGYAIIVNAANLPGGRYPHGGSWTAWLGGDNDEFSYINQRVTVSAETPVLRYWHWVDTLEPYCGWDIARVIIGNDIVVTENLCTKNYARPWTKKTVDLSAYIGSTVSIQFEVETDSTYLSSWYIDDVALEPSIQPTATATPTATNTSTATATPTSTATSTPTATATPSPTTSNTPTHTATKTATVTSTPTPSATNTATVTLTPTATNKATSTPTPTATNTATATSTSTPSATTTATVTLTKTAAKTATATSTPTPSTTNTATVSPTPTATKTATATSTSTPTATTTATVTLTPTATNTATATSTLTPTATNTATATSTPTPTPLVAPTAIHTATAIPTPTNPFQINQAVYLSLDSGGMVGGVPAQDVDILYYDGVTWSLFFDASDVGAITSGQDVNDFVFLDDDTILLVFIAPLTLDGLQIDPWDVVRFDATSLGTTTAGTFSMYLDGGDVGLDVTAETIDGLAVLSDGRVLVSTTGNPSVPGVTGSDEDILAFTPLSLGDVTSGTWSIYFDGSDVGLADLSYEDTDAIDIVDGNVYLSTVGDFSVPGVMGADEDVFICQPTSLGNVTGCDFSATLFFDGSTWGLADNDVDGIEIPAVSIPEPSPTPTQTNTATATQTPYATNTATVTLSPTPTGTSTPTATRTATVTLTPTPTATTTVTPTPTATNTVTATATLTSTATSAPTATPIRRGRLQVQTLVYWNGNSPDPSVSFEICIHGPSYSQLNCQTTNGGGLLIWENLLPGNYDITETPPSSSWQVSIISSPALVPENGGTVMVLVENSMISKHYQIFIPLLIY